jgi:hypothetical protein
MAESGPLKLRAHDKADLETLATILQDALVALGDVAYLKAEKRFILVANRFLWEDGGNRLLVQSPGQETQGDARFEDMEEGDGGPLYQRVNCGICFDWVNRVRTLGLDLKQKERILNLLTLEAEPGAVTLVFSGGGAIRLEVSGIRCHLEDLSEPWPTRWQPSHAADDPAV